MGALKEKLTSYMQQEIVVEIIYMDAAGQCTKRRVVPRMISDDSFVAYCLQRKAKRTFHYDRVLSYTPVMKKERMPV